MCFVGETCMCGCRRDECVFGGGKNVGSKWACLLEGKRLSVTCVSFGKSLEKILN